MGLEVANYIGGLVSTNPLGSDRKLQGDDHLRLIKSTIQNSFAGLTGAVVVGGVNGGIVNAYTLTPTPSLPSYTDNMSIVFSPVVANTGAVTMDVSGLGAISVQSVSGAPLVANDLVPGQKYRATYDGTAFRLFSITKNYADQLSFSTALPAQAGNTGKVITTDGTTASWTDTITIPFGFSSRVNESKGADIPSAATINLTTATGNLVHVTGTTGITAITIPSGAERTVVFDGVLTLTNSANLILPSGANITTAAGDSMKVRGDGVGVARVVSYTLANGRALVATNPGEVLIAGPFTPSVAANIDFLNVFTSTYDDYKIVFEGINPNTSVNDSLNMRLAVAGSADTGSNYFLANANNSNATAQTSFALNGGFSATGGNRGANFVVYVNNTNTTSATQVKSVLIFGADYTGSTPQVSSQVKSAAYVATNAVSGFRLFLSAGTSFAAQGTVKVYGISKV